MSSAHRDASLDRDEQAAFWCLTFSEGKLSAADRADFDRWVVDTANAHAFEEAAQMWNAADGAAETPELIHMRSAALESFRRANVQRWTKRVAPRWYGIGALAASLVVAILATAMFYTPGRVYQTGIGERQVAILADGSKLSLDADTEIDVRLQRDRRELTLVHGRAKFDVAKDPLRPFTVAAGSKMVVATGTSFSVELLEQNVHVLLYEGHVAVLDRTSKKPVQQKPSYLTQPIAADQSLMPGRELIASADTTKVRARIIQADTQRSLSWEAGQLSFDDEPLASAVERMNRYLNEKLVVGDPATASLRINGVFTAGDGTAFIEGLTMLDGIKASKDKDQITLRRN